MAKKSVKLYTDNVLEAFYDAIRTNSLDKLHIPHSDVFYVRQAVEAHYGRPFTLKHVEDAMRAVDRPWHFILFLQLSQSVYRLW